ncbi:demethylepipodophyllotoxin synthase-like [Vitis vinifera]|nr:demethylepipodophyllotoxin synthase-like [Vitis vinifera]|eukprot:XP_010656413.1 PREDICTED: cytochrome P450 82C4-like [Vitis vinifera]
MNWKKKPKPADLTPMLVKQTRNSMDVEVNLRLGSVMDFLHALLVVAVAGLLGMVLLCKVWRIQVRKGRSAPKPYGAWPFRGHLHVLCDQTPIFRTLGGMADKFGHVFMIRLGVHCMLVVTDHEAVKECFTINYKVFTSCPSFSFGKLLGYNYAAFGFVPYGPLWREICKLLKMEILIARRLDALKHV